MDEERILRALGGKRPMRRLDLAGLCESSARGISPSLERLIRQGRVLQAGPGEVVLSRCLGCGARGEPLGKTGRCAHCRAGGLR